MNDRPQFVLESLRLSFLLSVRHGRLAPRCLHDHVGGRVHRRGLWAAGRGWRCAGDTGPHGRRSRHRADHGRTGQGGPGGAAGGDDPDRHGDRRPTSAGRPGGGHPDSVAVHRLLRRPDGHSDPPGELHGRHHRPVCSLFLLLVITSDYSRPLTLSLLYTVMQHVA